MRTIAMLLLLVAGTAEAGKPTVVVLDVQTTDVHGYAVTAEASLAAVKDKGAELAACTKGWKLDVAAPVVSVLQAVELEVGADGKVVEVRKPRLPGVAAACLAPLVARWTFADPGVLTVRLGIVPAGRARRLKASYVKALTAVCAVAPSADLQDTATRVRAALAAHPDADVEKLLRAFSGRFPSERRTLAHAVLVNAGVSSCPVLEP